MRHYHLASALNSALMGKSVTLLLRKTQEYIYLCYNSIDSDWQMMS